jgi:hypothetical protein
VRTQVIVIETQFSGSYLQNAPLAIKTTLEGVKITLVRVEITLARVF